MPKKKPGVVHGININLKEKPRDTVGNVFVKWGINSGKIIIVLTELVALSALFYRFNIDRKIVDLNDQIKQEQIFIDNQAPKEKEYRSIQKRLDQIKLITNETDEKVALMDSIITTLRTQNFSNTNLSISKNTIQVSGDAISIFVVNSFINDLKQSPKVKNITLDEVNSTDNGIQFAIAIELNSNIPNEIAPPPAQSSEETL